MDADEMRRQHEAVMHQAERVKQAIHWYTEGLYTRNELARITLDAGIIMQAHTESGHA